MVSRNSPTYYLGVQNADVPFHFAGQQRCMDALPIEERFAMMSVEHL